VTDTDTSTSTPNAARAWEVYDLAMRHRAALNMKTYVRVSNELLSADVDNALRVTLNTLTSECGTTACLAGWTVTHEGYRMDRYGAVYGPDGAYLGVVFRVATNLLGLTDETAIGLFNVADEYLEQQMFDTFGPRPTNPEGIRP